MTTTRAPVRLPGSLLRRERKRGSSPSITAPHRFKRCSDQRLGFGRRFVLDFDPHDYLGDGSPAIPTLGAREHSQGIFPTAPRSALFFRTRVTTQTAALQPPLPNSSTASRGPSVLLTATRFGRAGNTPKKPRSSPFCRTSKKQQCFTFPVSPRASSLGKRKRRRRAKLLSGPPSRPRTFQPPAGQPNSVTSPRGRVWPSSGLAWKGSEEKWCKAGSKSVKE